MKQTHGRREHGEILLDGDKVAATVEMGQNIVFDSGLYFRGAMYQRLVYGGRFNGGLFEFILNDDTFLSDPH